MNTPLLFRIMNGSKLIGLSLIVIFLASCSKREIELDEADPTMIKAISESLIESSDTGNSEQEVLWEPGDEIAVFSAELSGKFVSALKKEPSAAAVFRGELGLESWPEEMDLWAVYPYSEEAIFDGETITTMLPSEQIAKDGSLGKGMNLAIAHSNTSILQFYNVGGAIRFSVTEEGIRKVMFEGLNGEIISGKVKIGFEEGLPVVKEVISGSQFITLLPPAGKETFEKDTWYYIVAIPGTLEDGYKLRFYKDSNYARKVSEKTVAIKRSIYGSIEQADNGIEYAPQATHFPETMEEWEASVALTYDTGDQVKAIINQFRLSQSESFDSLCAELKSIDGIIYAETDDAHTVISVKQKDQLWVNYLLASDTDTITPLSESDSNSENHIPRKYQDNRKGGLWNGKTALFLSPFQTVWQSNLKYRKDLLENLGFKVIEKNDGEANVNAFLGESLTGYDFIYINTHGGLLHKVSSKDDDTIVTCFATSTEYTPIWVIDNNVQGGLNEFAIAAPEEDNKFYVCVTPDALGNSQLDGTCVMSSACMSLAISSGESSMADAFIKHGASAFTGYQESINRSVADLMTRYILLFLCEGVSLEESATYWFSSSYLASYCNAVIDYLKNKDSNADVRAVNHRLFAIKLSESNSGPFYLADSTPYLFEPVSQDGAILLKWSSIPQPKTIRDGWKDAQGNIEYYDCLQFSVNYDLVIDGEGISSLTTPEYGYAFLPGDYSWHVITNFQDDKASHIIASFQSEEKHFTVKDPTYSGDIEGTEEDPWN